MPADNRHAGKELPPGRPARPSRPLRGNTLPVMVSSFALPSILPLMLCAKGNSRRTQITPMVHQHFVEFFDPAGFRNRRNTFASRSGEGFGAPAIEDK